MKQTRFCYLQSQNAPNVGIDALSNRQSGRLQGLSGQSQVSQPSNAMMTRMNLREDIEDQNAPPFGWICSDGWGKTPGTPFPFYGPILNLNVYLDWDKDLYWRLHSEYFDIFKGLRILSALTAFRIKLFCVGPLVPR